METTDPSSLEITESDITCSDSSSQFVGLVHLTENINFRCAVRDTLRNSNPVEYSESFVVNSYCKSDTLSFMNTICTSQDKNKDGI